MNRIVGVLIEAFVVGIISIIIGYLAGYIVGRASDVNLPEECKNWNKNYVMEKSLFLTGFLIHIICQVSGINHWYCKNGIACIN